MNTYNDVFLETRRRLRAAGIEAYDLEARLIMAHATGKSREELLRDGRIFVADGAVTQEVDHMVVRRINGEPVAYIVGEWEFYGLPITVNESVLIPRVDTEVLAQEAIALMKRHGGRTRLLDLCAGSGCVGLAVAHNVPNCRVILADNCTEALKICRANMQKNNLTRNVTAIEADALSDPPQLLGRFDAIISNPPYIPTGDIATLDVSVRDFEPAAALDGGPDGLKFFREIAQRWKALLKDGGYLAFECGIDQAQDVRGILKRSGFADVRTIEDTIGIERVVVGKLENQE